MPRRGVCFAASLGWHSSASATIAVYAACWFVAAALTEGLAGQEVPEAACDVSAAHPPGGDRLPAAMLPISPPVPMAWTAAQFRRNLRLRFTFRTSLLKVGRSLHGSLARR